MRGKRAGAYTPRRGGGGGGSDESNRWLGTYGDAITLLMAFFVMLYAMSEVDVQKFEAFVSGLQGPFGNRAAEQGLLDGQPSVIDDGAADSMPGDDLGPIVPVDVVDPISPVRPPQTLPPSDDLAQLEQVQQAVMSSLAAAGMQDLASFRFDGRGLVLTLATDNVLFPSGSTAISDRGRELIAAVAAPLRQFRNDVFVEGHTDDVPLNRGSYTNWNLSTDRAVAVVSLLATDHGFSQDRLGAAGYAEFRPRAGNDSDAGRSANRRVDILVVAESAATAG